MVKLKSIAHFKCTKVLVDLLLLESCVLRNCEPTEWLSPPKIENVDL